MALDPDNIRVYGDGEAYIAAYGTTLPSTLSGALASGFGSLGYLVEDGITITPERETMEVKAWQAYGPVDIRPTSQTVRVAIPSLEIGNDVAFRAYWDGGSFSSSGAGERKFTPPTTSSISRWSVVIDLDDGNDTERYVFDRCVLTERDGITVNKGAAGTLAMTFTVLSGEDGSQGWSRFDSRTVTS